MVKVGLGLGLRSVVVGDRLRSGMSVEVEGWVKVAEGSSKGNRGSKKWSRDWQIRYEAERGKKTF
jgi:hypothetical protein